MSAARDIEAVRLLSIIEAGQLARRRHLGLPAGWFTVIDPAARNARSAETRRGWETRGWCRSCGRPDPGGARCEDCRIRANALQRERAAARRAAGLCASCPAPAESGASLCGRHLALKRARRKRASADTPRAAATR